MKKLFVAPELDVVRLAALARANEGYDPEETEGPSEPEVDVSQIP